MTYQKVILKLKFHHNAYIYNLIVITLPVEIFLFVACLVKSKENQHPSEYVTELQVNIAATQFLEVTFI